jgi:hypothetical protein
MPHMKRCPSINKNQYCHLFHIEIRLWPGLARIQLGQEGVPRDVVNARAVLQSMSDEANDTIGCLLVDDEGYFLGFASLKGSHVNCILNEVG